MMFYSFCYCFIQVALNLIYVYIYIYIWFYKLCSFVRIWEAPIFIEHKTSSKIRVLCWCLWRHSYYIYIYVSTKVIVSLFHPYLPDVLSLRLRTRIGKNVTRDASATLPVRGMLQRRPTRRMLHYVIILVPFKKNQQSYKKTQKNIIFNIFPPEGNFDSDARDGGGGDPPFF